MYKHNSVQTEPEMIVKPSKSRRHRMYIDEHAEDALKDYHYIGTEASVLSPYLTPYWNFICSLLPQWIAPNLLTLASFLAVVFIFLMICITSPNFVPNVDAWYHWYMYVLFAFLLHFYQTIDAVDGKQARRTNSSSPLGELFDHGLDSVNTAVFHGGMACCLLQYGNTSMSFITHLALGLVFYIVFWEEYATLVLRLGKYFSVTEILTATELGLILNAFSKGWPVMYEIPILTYLFGEKTYVSCSVALILLALVPLNLKDSIQHAFEEIDKQTDQVKERGITKVNVIMGLCPCFSMSFMFAIWFWIDRQFYDEHTILFCATFGTILSYISTRTVIHRVCSQRIYWFYTIMVPPISAFIINNFLVHDHKLLVFWGMLFSILLIYFHLAYFAINEICEVLDISLFRIKHS